MADAILQLFKPDDITVELNGKKEALVYDMNAVLEIEEIYGSIDTVFKMLFSQAESTHTVKVNGEETDINTILVDEIPLIQFLQAEDNKAKSAIKDTINLLWIGLLHNHTKRDDDGDIISCDITKAQVRTGISFKKLAELNLQVVSALIRDLIAPDKEEENIEGKIEELKN